MEFAAKRAADQPPGDGSQDPPRKQARGSAGDADFSTPVRSKLSASSRTGQACDRCKVRKIKCDGNPNGCAPCQQAQHTCKTTDRNNGRTTTRGHADRLEWQNRELQNKIAQLEQRLRSAGIPTEDGTPQPMWDTLERNTAQAPQVNGLPSSHRTASPAPPPVPEADLSILKGTTLSLFGMQIDVANFTRSVDDPDCPTGLDTYLKYALGKAHVDPVPALPKTLGEAQQTALAYLRALNPFTPILHKPDFFPILTKMYEGRRVTPAQEVMVHMMFAEIKYQYGQRNPQQGRFLNESYAHYKFSLNFYHDLLLNRTIEDLQAMLLIAVKQRNFPKPGAAWGSAQLCMSLAIQLNLHRSANSLPEEERIHLTYHQKEMRKRVFWIAYTLSIQLSMKLALPVRLRAEDIDIEFPDPEPDDLLDEPGSCSFHAGIAAIKVLEITGRMLCALFTPKRCPAHYAMEMPKYDREIREWRRSLRSDLRDPPFRSNENEVQALFMHFWELEMLFFLRHPVIHSSPDPRLNADNTRVMLEVTSDMLGVVTRMGELNCIDVPWINITVFLAAVFTTLFIHEQKQEEISVQELHKLESDMAQWLTILRGIGQILGTGDNLADYTRFVVDQTLERIRERVRASSAATDAARVLDRTSSETHQHGPAETTTYPDIPPFSAPQSHASTNSQQTVDPRQEEYASNAQNRPAGAQNPYPSSSQSNNPYPYPESSLNGTHPYPNAPAYTPNRYSAVPASESSQLPTAMQGQAAPSGQTTQSTIFPIPNEQMYYPQQPPTSPVVQQWMRWTETNFQTFPPNVSQEYANPASALVALGGHVPPQTAVQSAIPWTDDGAGQAGQWPMNLLLPGHQNGGGGGV